MKYLSEFFVPYDSFLETNTLLTSKSYILNSFLFLIIKIYAFSALFLCWVKKKCNKIFYNNLGVMRISCILRQVYKSDISA